MLQSLTSLIIYLSVFEYCFSSPTNRLKFLDKDSFDVMNRILSDPCLRANCLFGEICIQNPDRTTYTCIDEKSLAVKIQEDPNKDPNSFVTNYKDDFDIDDMLINYPKEFHDEYLNFDDPCLSSPCSFGTVCKAGANLREYMCVDERSFYSPIKNSQSHLNQQQMFQTVNDLFRKIPTESSFTQLKGTSKKVDPCLSNPCPNELECVISKSIKNAFECVEKKQLKEIHSITQNSENPTEKTDHQDKINNQEKVVITDMRDLCKNVEPGTRVAHPENNNQFLSCSADGGFALLSCPETLFYNKYSDRCDLSPDPISTGCGSMPCQYDSDCIDLPDDKYRCQCKPGYSGINCEIQPDFCTSNPCGKKGECVSLPWDSPLPYYCTCEDEKYFGMSCDKSAEKNPCLHDHEHTVFPTKIDSAIYVHCNDDKLSLKYCHTNSAFSVATNNCEWIDIQKIE